MYCGDRSLMATPPFCFLLLCPLWMTASERRSLPALFLRGRRWNFIVDDTRDDDTYGMEQEGVFKVSGSGRHGLEPGDRWIARRRAPERKG